MPGIEDRIKHFIENEVIVEDGLLPLDVNYALLENGVVDSASLVSLVTFLEVEFQMQVPRTDLVPEHFESVKAIADYVESTIT